jgi:hypothetical protein
MKLPDVQNNSFITRITYELFISLVAIISLATVTCIYFIPIPSVVKQVLIITDSLTAVVLLTDFFLRFINQPNKKKYIFGPGFLDLVSSIPALPFLRYLRLPRLILTFRTLRKSKSQELRAEVRERLADNSVMIVILAFLLIITIGSSLVVVFEAKSDQANIVTGEEAVWWSVVTIATVGYGDYYPVTSSGRIVGSVMMILGVSIFTTLTSFIASKMMSSRQVGKTDFERLEKEIMALNTAQHRQDTKSIVEENSPLDKGNSPDQDQ